MRFLRNKYIEIVIVFFVIYAISKYISPNNPLFYDSDFGIYFYALVTISLFYGFDAGMLFLVLFFGVGYLVYHKINFYLMSHYFVLLFIFSEFYYFWQKKISLLEQTNKFIKSRLENLGVNYYLLKTSHDEMEQNYILKPFSSREILLQIRNMIKQKKSQTIKTFLLLLSKIFKIESGAFYVLEDDRYVSKGTIGDIKNLDFKDPLIQKVMTDKTILYTDITNTNNNSKYLAVVPIVSSDEILKGFFVIKELPFFNLNNDTLFSISLFLSYFSSSCEKIEKYAKYGFDEEFVAELDKMLLLYKRFKLQSYVVVFDAPQVELAYIESMLRGSDIGLKKENKLFVLSFLSSPSSIVKFVDRIRQYSKNIKHNTIEIKHNNLSQLIEDIRNV